MLQKKINKNHLNEKDFFTIRKRTNVFIGIGNIKPRIKILNILLNGNYNFPNFISKKSHIMKKLKLVLEILFYLIQIFYLQLKLEILIY